MITVDFLLKITIEKREGYLVDTLANPYTALNPIHYLTLS